MIDRRQLLGAAAALMVVGPTLARARGSSRSFPHNFLWGAATAGHQVEGNNINSDCWVLENVHPTAYAERSADAANSFALWQQDLDLVKGLGLNSYRFSLEWARIEPEPGLFSVAMLDHYQAMIEGCRERSLTPVVTFNHFTTPRWFAEQGGWLNPAAPDLFAKFCDRSARHLAAGIGYATTLNEPNLFNLLRVILPPAMLSGLQPMLAAARRATASENFVGGNAVAPEDIDAMTVGLIAGHKAGRAAIKSVRPDLPVGVSLAMPYDVAVGENSLRDEMRVRMYQPWLDAVRGDDFLGVQNYERQMWDSHGRLPAPKGVPVNYAGAEVYPPSLAGSVRYAHEATGLPILVTEHGVGTNDDAIRANLIPAALRELKTAMDEGVPVLGYLHWSLLDNFEWIFGYRVKFGLHSVDPVTFHRTPKPSAHVLATIARSGAVPA
jgi:beta-glucosidase